MNQVDLRMRVLLAQYERVKEEIFHHKTTQQTIVNFIIILTAVEITLLTDSSILSNNPLSSPNSWILLIVPIPFALLALYHTAYTKRVHNLASFLDGEMKAKLEAIVGEETLHSISYHPTRNIFALPKSLPDGRITYIALLGLKGLPQILPLILYLNMKTSTWEFLEIIWFLTVCLLMVISVVGQHD